MKSQELLDSFIKYCQEHPEERFWQALRNWTNWHSILAVKFVSFDKTDRAIYEGVEDTYYWKENKSREFAPPNEYHFKHFK